MNSNLPEPIEFKVIEVLPDTPANRELMARHVSWLIVKQKLNRYWASQFRTTFTMECCPLDDGVADKPIIIESPAETC
jgi:hypothetical protein